MEEQELQTDMQTIGINDTHVMPTHRELIRAREFGISVEFGSPYAVYIRKIASTQRADLIDSLNDDQDAIQTVCQDFDKEFFVNFQFGKGINFNDDELSYMEGVQQIEELSRICMNEKSEHQTVQEFEAQLNGWKSRNDNKTLVPVLDPATNDLIKKIIIIKKNKLTECGVIFRGYTRDEDKANLSIILQNLRAMEISSIVFGVFPRKQKVSKASMLLPVLQFKANVIAPYFPWGGGKSEMELICNDWIYRTLDEADDGAAEYAGQNRKDAIQDGGNRVTFNTAFGQIDLIHQANLMAQTFIPLPEIEIERLFN
jgi:hypothetical protein